MKEPRRLPSPVPLDVDAIVISTGVRRWYHNFSRLVDIANLPAFRKPVQCVGVPVAGNPNRIVPFAAQSRRRDQQQGEACANEQAGHTHCVSVLPRYASLALLINTTGSTGRVKHDSRSVVRGGEVFDRKVSGQNLLSLLCIS